MPGGAAEAAEDVGEDVEAAVVAEDAPVDGDNFLSPPEAYTLFGLNQAGWVTHLASGRRPVSDNKDGSTCVGRVFDRNKVGAPPDEARRVSAPFDAGQTWPLRSMLTSVSVRRTVRCFQSMRGRPFVGQTAIDIRRGNAMPELGQDAVVEPWWAVLAITPLLVLGIFINTLVQ